ncbi:MAG: biotin transporter BioY [Parachlamydiales bacterium]|nr:biotin transporter BioY [Parachlamydiales bacterium]
MQKVLTTKRFLENIYFKDVLIIVFSALFLGLFSKIYIPLFFTPIPLVLQNSLAISYGFYFKDYRSYTSVLLFLLLGALGLPVFFGGHFGVKHLFSTNCGYLFGYALAALFVSKMCNLKTQKKLHPALIIFLGHMLVLFMGWCWFSYFVGLKKAFILGVLPFIPFDIFKTAVIAKFIKYKNS